MSEEALEGHQSTSRMMLHDYEVEYIVKNITKESAQNLLNSLPEDWYIIEKYYENSKNRLEFTIMLDDVSPLGITDHIDYMENNHPECKVRFQQLHDFKTSFDDSESDEYNANAIDLTKFNDRTLP